MGVNMRRLVIAGLSGDSGKTVVSLSLLAALRQRRMSLSTFKKGPDYIDAAWLSHISRSTCRNLDTYMSDPKDVYRSFVAHAANTDLAVIEGNRGLFDGKDVDGTHSTAELAKLLQSPVVLVVNTTKATRTLAAVVNGCVAFDRKVNIAGIILNKIAGKRHGKIIAEAIEKYCHLPVLGIVPKLEDDSTLIPGRHLGLVPPEEFETDERLDDRLAAIAEEYLDVDALIEVASNAPPLEVPRPKPQVAPMAKVKIGYFKDSAFTFYYPENLEALQAHGAELIPIHSLRGKELPDIDALYIGGGFPETHAEQLAANRSMLASVKQHAERELPIYAECGGLIFLSRSLTVHDNVYPMASVFPIDVQLHPKPVGHGYSLVQVDHENPFFKIGAVIKGHEFHYSGVVPGSEEFTTCLEVKSGVGVGQNRDGILYKNVMACYTHIHATGVPAWALAVVQRACEFRSHITSIVGRVPNPPEADEKPDTSVSFKERVQHRRSGSDSALSGGETRQKVFYKPLKANC
jgi:cobyrinic acid a,c-diamide synthase